MAPPSPSKTAASTPPRRDQFALTGPSAVLDPRVYAVRADLADVRLASRVFAPHYAAAILVRLRHATDLRDGPDLAAAALARLAEGAEFELLERSGGRGWGVAPGVGLVGYLDAAAL